MGRRRTGGRRRLATRRIIESDSDEEGEEGDAGSDGEVDDDEVDSDGNLADFIVGSSDEEDDSDDSSSSFTSSSSSSSSSTSSSDGGGSRGRKRGKGFGRKKSESTKKKYTKSDVERFTRTKASISRRDALTAKMFRELNEIVFEGRLPDDLDITWNARLNTTAGYTIFARPKPGGCIVSAFPPSLVNSSIPTFLTNPHSLTHSLNHSLIPFLTQKRASKRSCSFCIINH